MLKQRIITSILLIPLVVITLFYVSLPVFSCVLIALCGLAVWEWGQFLAFNKIIHKATFACVAMILLTLLNFYPFSTELRELVFFTILIASIFWWIIAFFMVASYPSTARWWSHCGLVKLFFALFTITPFFVGIIELRGINYQINHYVGSMWLLYLFVLVWATDTGAYFVGKMLGKSKLAPKVSPGKTVEGFLGGVFTSIVVSVGVYYANVFSISFYVFFISSLLAIFVSVLGDLVESMFKRQAGIKDSGNIIPGHGGILDRIDSLTAAVPIFSVFTLHIL